jgi:hypothetical protein
VLRLRCASGICLGLGLGASLVISFLFGGSQAGDPIGLL